MGCDIHLHIEAKINGKWEHYGCPNIKRWYPLFSIMAGVRNRENDAPISYPKGLPDNLSILTRIDADHWKDDGHDWSWLDLEEIGRLKKWLENQPDHPDLEWDILHCYLFGNSFPGLQQWPDEYPKEIDDIRFVFWFDN